MIIILDRGKRQGKGLRIIVIVESLLREVLGSSLIFDLLLNVKMLLNGLGFFTSPLYLFTEFFRRCLLNYYFIYNA